MNGSLHTHAIRLRHPMRRSDGCIEQRASIHLHLEHQGVFGYGEAAPMPLHGGEHYDACYDALSAWQHDLSPVAALNNVDDAARLCAALSATPCAQFCAESACLDLLARRQHLPLYQLLNPQAAGSLSVHMNALTTAMSPASIQCAAADGCTYLKYKTGCTDPASDGAALDAYAAACADAVDSGSSIRLRPDANGAWSLDEARRLLATRPPATCAAIDYLEDPCADFADLAALARTATIAIAYDVPHAGVDAPTLATQHALAVYVIKPMLYGSPSALVRDYHQIIAAGKRCVLTSFMEGPIGRACVAHLCAACDSAGLEHHGLDTTALIMPENDSMISDITWQRPTLHLNHTMRGHGVSP